MSEVPDIVYRPRGRVSSLRIGAHASQDAGALGAFRDQVPFMAHPDARRIDVRATLRDPLGNTYVRRFRQRIAVDVYALVDLSGSMTFRGHAAKMDLVADLCAALARSSTRSGDRFGLIGCDAVMREDCVIPATKRRAISDEVRDRLGRAECRGAHAEGLKAAAEQLTGARKLVFLISDFLFPLNLLREIFEALARHDVVPIIVRDDTEDTELPAFGLTRVVDLETGAPKLIFMRRQLKQRWIEAERQRQAEIADLARRFGRAPVMLSGVFDAEQFSRHLLEA